MMGYVTPEKSELKVWEYDVYMAYYCGLCRSVGKTYGNVPRLLLNYDFVFLALLLSSISDEPDRVEARRCAVRPYKKRNMADPTAAIEYSADMMVALGYFKLRDDWKDEGSLAGLAAGPLLGRAFRKAWRRLPEKAAAIEGFMRDLGVLEREPCASYDRAAEPFASIMEEAMDYGRPRADGHEAAVRHALRQIGRHLGKWIYLIDAFDDIEKDIAKNNYNPLVLNYAFRQGENAEESVEAFKGRIHDRVALNSTLCLSKMAEVFELLPVTRHRGILENIIYLGLLRRSEEALGGQKQAGKA